MSLTCLLLAALFNGFRTRSEGPLAAQRVHRWASLHYSKQRLQLLWHRLI